MPTIMEICSHSAIWGKLLMLEQGNHGVNRRDRKVSGVTGF
jgi:hypothetical protein